MVGLVGSYSFTFHLVKNHIADCCWLLVVGCLGPDNQQPTTNN